MLVSFLIGTATHGFLIMLINVVWTDYTWISLKLDQGSYPGNLNKNVFRRRQFAEAVARRDKAVLAVKLHEPSITGTDIPS